MTQLETLKRLCAEECIYNICLGRFQIIGDRLQQQNYAYFRDISRFLCGRQAVWIVLEKEKDVLYSV